MLRRSPSFEELSVCSNTIPEATCKRNYLDGIDTHATYQLIPECIPFSLHVPENLESLYILGDQMYFTGIRAVSLTYHCLKHDDSHWSGLRLHLNNSVLQYWTERLEGNKALKNICSKQWNALCPVISSKVRSVPCKMKNFFYICTVLVTTYINDSPFGQCTPIFTNHINIRRNRRFTTGDNQLHRHEGLHKAKLNEKKQKKVQGFVFSLVCRNL